MEQYLTDLKIKWRTSLDLLAEEVDAPYGVFIRSLPQAWEIFTTNSGVEQSFPNGLCCSGQLTELELPSMLKDGIYCRQIDMSRINRNLQPLLVQKSISHYCGFSVMHGDKLFGLLFLAGDKPFLWGEKRKIFFRRFKTLLEQDLQAVADKARYCDELTRTRLLAKTVGSDLPRHPQDSPATLSDFPHDRTAGGAIHPETIPVLPLMDEIHRSHESYMPRDVKFVTRIRCPSDYSLFTDSYFLKQILSRLLVHSENHTYQGEIKIECRLDKEHDTFIFSVYGSGKSLARENWNEGLAPSRSLTEKLGGRLTVSNGQSGGTLFTLALPLDHHARATA